MKKTNSKNLLPVVVIRDRRATTSSLEVARIFTKKHKNVLQDIGNLGVSESFSWLNFQPRDYKDERGKTQKMYEMTRDGFVFLVMGYRGEKAAAFKEAYIGEFNRREAEILRLRTVLASNKQNIELQEVRTAGKVIRRDETDAIQSFVEYAIGQGSQNAKRYYLLLTKMANSLLFDMQTKAVNTRDVCNVNQIGSLKVVDTIITRAIEEDMAQGIPYKTVFQNVKSKVQMFVSLYGRSEIPGSTLQIGGN